MTDKIGHTPGPWAHFDMGDIQGVDVGQEANGENPCIVHWSGFENCELPMDECAANARLISAAPDLLDALKLVEEHYGEDSDIFCIVRGAIAKAEGRV